MNLRSEGDEAASKLVKEITTTTPTRARRVLTKWRKKEPIQTQLSEDEALSMIINADLTKNQYQIIRMMAEKMDISYTIAMKEYGKLSVLRVRMVFLFPEIRAK